MKLHNKIFWCIVAPLWISLMTGCATVSGFFGDGEKYSTPVSDCVLLTPENAHNPVSACETAEAYKIRVLDVNYDYNQYAFRKTLLTKIFMFARETSYPIESLRDAQLEIWLVSPVFTPRNTVFRVFVASRSGNFLVKLPLDMRNWKITRDNVLLLGSGEYPAMSAKKAGTVFIEAHGSASSDEVKNLLTDLDLAVPNGLQLPGFILKTEVFGERRLAEKITKHKNSGRLIKKIDYIAEGDLAGSKTKAFSFAFTK